MNKENTSEQILEIAKRIRELREIVGFTVEQMAAMTEVSAQKYASYENGNEDFPFTFLHKCSLAFGVEITALLEGKSARLSTYAITRKGGGILTAEEDGIAIKNMAAMFRQKLATPYFVKYAYSDELQGKPIHTTTHAGQEFDLVLKGSMRIRIGEHEEVLNEGDSVFYKSSTPHGMIAIGGNDVEFLAMIMSSSEKEQTFVIAPRKETKSRRRLGIEKFVRIKENEDGSLAGISYENDNEFNFAYDVVDSIAREYPDKLAMVHVSNDGTERRFTFKDMKDCSSQTANYFASLGIKRGDRVLLILKRHYQFWFSILALHKIGAIAIPATNQLMSHDLEYRIKSAGVSAIVCTGDGIVAEEAEKGEKAAGVQLTKIMVNGKRAGWHDYNSEFGFFSRRFVRQPNAPCGNDTMLMMFTSGTTGYPKIAMHSYRYPLGHFVTAKYWHMVEEDGLHFTISETGWGKALWGKLYGQWMCEGAVFVYDFDRFDADKILPMFKQYSISTFCAPPTIYRMLIKQDISRFDLSSIHHASTAGEALNPEVFKKFKEITGLQIMEGFGQTETTLIIGNLAGNSHKIGAMGRVVPPYDIHLLDPDGKEVPIGENGEICISLKDGMLPGLSLGYYNNLGETVEKWHDGWYHTGDLAWKDEDGLFWYVGRKDDVIKSSGYRIGPFEVENVIMELPYILECGVSAAPDPVRGQVVKASIVLVKGKQASEALKKEIQEYVKTHTAPYKYPRIVEFKESLPKTISGKIIRSKL